ncbi:MAG: hypothetical protein J6M56_00240 [Clostridia bacterium]|nr:hypothetical protein [Clostridia bacterium]
MTKSDERAAQERSLIIKGEMQKSEIAEMCGYKSIGGMMGAITMLEHKERTGKGVSNKARRSLQSFTPYEGPTTQRQQRKADRTFRGGSPWAPVDLLGGDEPKTLRVDVERNNGLYARLEGRNLLVSYIGYRKSLNIEAKRVPGRSLRLFETELGYKGAMLDALHELREIADRLIALLEGREDAKQDQ